MTARQFALKRIIFIVLFLPFCSAWTEPKEPTLDEKIQRVLDHTLQLEQQLASLRQEVSILKKEKVHLTDELKTVEKKQHRIEHALPTRAKDNDPNLAYTPAGQATHDLRNDLYGTTPTYFLGGLPVITTPYIGLRSAFDASDLIVNISSVNLDLRLLRQKKALHEALQAVGKTVPIDRPLVELSGKVEVTASTHWGFDGSDTSDINLSEAEFDVVANMGHWADAFLQFSYDSSTDDLPRTSNSRFFLNKGFLTIGNLKSSPFYGSGGQMILPFGRYSSNMLSSPLTLRLARDKKRAIVLGYQQPGDNALFASFYRFRGDTLINDHHQGGFNVAYLFNHGGVRGEMGFGMITNFAEADGQQRTGAPALGIDECLDDPSGLCFTGYGQSSETEQLHRRVPGMATYLIVGFENYRFLLEYVGATRSYDTRDLTFNGENARPEAFNVEASYQFEWMEKPSSVAIGFGHTDEALAFNLPKYTYKTIFSTSLWRNTIQSIEYCYERNYGGSSSATGAGQIVATGNAEFLGRSAHSLTAQFGVYF